MASDTRFSDEEWSALALGPAAAAAAMLATSRPSFFGTFKELRSGLRALKSQAPTEPPAADLVRDLLAYAEAHQEDGKALETDSDDKEAMRTTALEALGRAGVAAAKLSPAELDGYVGWLVGAARVMAQSTSDKGEKAAVSSTEEATLAEIERRLRRT